MVSVVLTWILMPAAEYLPNGNQNFVFGGMLPPPGYNIDQLMKAGETIEAQFRPLWEADDEAAKAMLGGGVDNFFYVGFGSIAFLGVRSRDAGRAHELVPLANQAIFSIPGNIGFAQQASLFGSAAGGTRSMRIDVTGPGLPQVLQTAAKIFGQIGQVLPGSGSRPSPGLDSAILKYVSIRTEFVPPMSA